MDEGRNQKKAGDLCLCAPDTNSICAKSVRRNGDYYEEKDKKTKKRGGHVCDHAYACGRNAHSMFQR